MSFGDEEVPSTIATQHQHHHHLLDWLEDSISFLPSFFDDPYTVSTPITATNDITGYEWWAPDLDQAHHTNTPPVITVVENPTTATTTITTDSLELSQPELSKKRKPFATPTPANHHNRRRITADTGECGNGEQDEEIPRKPGHGRKAAGKGTGGSSANGSSKEVRWAEQLLNPCAAAIDGGNLSRVQHLLYVLQELASPSGDVNHRLATHGLRALACHLSSASAGAGVTIPAVPAAPSFASTEPRLFRSALIRFHEVSPWFAFPNALANSSILHITTAEGGQRPPKALHVIDIGVSHGMQWPTLLEATTRRPSGAPPLVRLTFAAGAAAPPPAPFSSAPLGYDFPSHLLRYAKSINLNLSIHEAEALDADSLSIGADEALVVCIQFRAAAACGSGDELLRSVRKLSPDLVVLTEIDGGEGVGDVGEGVGDAGFARGFGRRVEMLWKFLDSTSAAFKGRDCGERRVVEGEAASMLEAAVAEGRERWRERMMGAGFAEEGFGEEAMDAGRALLRKYDGNWEMRPAVAPPAEAAAPAAVGLWWKGQSVSFCSLWKPLGKGSC